MAMCLWGEFGLLELHWVVLLFIYWHFSFFYFQWNHLTFPGVLNNTCHFELKEAQKFEALGVGERWCQTRTEVCVTVLHTLWGDPFISVQTADCDKLAHLLCRRTTECHLAYVDCAKPVMVFVFNREFCQDIVFICAYLSSKICECVLFCTFATRLSVNEREQGLSVSVCFPSHCRSLFLSLHHKTAGRHISNSLLYQAWAITGGHTLTHTT